MIVLEIVDEFSMYISQ